MTKKSVLSCILSLILLAYMVVSISWAVESAQGSLCSGVTILVDSAGSKFVSVKDIAREMDVSSGKYDNARLGTLNTDSIETRLNKNDKIETANCVILSDGRLLVEVVPMLPIARFFENGESFYINRDGKRITADRTYHMDVPLVIAERGDSTFSDTSLIPLLNAIKSDSTWNALVSAIKITPNRDIIIIPMIRGHVINFGDTSNVQNKLARLRTMYKKVFPAKGWDYYDTLSVKWSGQVVATRRTKKMTEPLIKYDEYSENDDVEVATMETN